jgi:hypothetical protein
MSEKIAPKTHQMKLRNSNKKNQNLSKKKIESDNSNDSDSSWVDEEDDEEEETYEDEDEDDKEYSVKEFRELLSNMFPSNYIKEKTKNTDPTEKLVKDKSKIKETKSNHSKNYTKSKYKKECGVNWH